MEPIRCMNKRVRALSQTTMFLAVGIIVPMAVEHSNEEQPMHLPTVFFAYLTFLSAVALRALVCEVLHPIPGPVRYFSIKVLVHTCPLFLISLDFSLSLMMGMNVFMTSPTVAAAGVFIAHRLWQCATTEIGTDVEAYTGWEEELQQLLDLSGDVMSMLFSGWFAMAFFLFQKYSAEALDARFLPSEYLTFFACVAAPLTMLKAVPRSLAPSALPVRELKALIYALLLGVTTVGLATAASKVGGYAALVLLPEAVALAAWALPVQWTYWLAVYEDGVGEPASHSFVTMALSLLLAVLTFRAKGGRGLSSLYDEAFVLVITANLVAALGWNMVTQRTTPAGPGEQVAAKILAFFTFWLLVLSMLSFSGVMFGL